MEDDAIDTYEQIINFRHKDNLSPEFQVRMIMYKLNDMLAQGKYSFARMKEMNNVLRLLSILLNSPSQYTVFDFNKYDGRPEDVQDKFCEHMFNSYTNLINIAKKNGMWTIDIIDEVIE